MRVKERIYQVIEKYPSIMKLYIKRYNRFLGQIDNISIRGVKIRNNKIELNGEKNSISCGLNCSIQNSKYNIRGCNNTITVKDGVEKFEIMR